jgi:glycopeptide antibiotics resistance protein
VRLFDRRLLVAAYLVYLAAVLELVLWPRPDTPSGAVAAVTGFLHAIGLQAVGEPQVEVALNVLLFVPLGLIGVLLVRRLPWSAWAVVGLGFSLFLEGCQWAFLPERTPALSDVLANTIGSALGALLGSRVRGPTSAARPGTPGGSTQRGGRLDGWGLRGAGGRGARR